MLEVSSVESPAAVTTWRAKDLLDTDTLHRDDIELILETAEAMREVRARPVGKVATLRGATVITLFYEQSTRTRASFEVAAKALGADVVNLTATGSSVEKGESLIDTVRTLEAIGADIVVMRHGKSGAPYLAARHTGASVINGGDGTHAHPTQALLDLFTMRRRLGSVEGKRVVIVGDVLHSRVARSNVWALLAAGADICLAGPATLLPRTLAGASERGRVEVTSDLDSAIRGADVVMALRIQKERQDAGLIPSLREYIAGYQVNARRMALAAPGALLMHPGPMNEGVEVAPEVAHGASSVIEEQVTNGVAVRMAILYLLSPGEAGLMETLLIRGGRVIDPAAAIDAVVDVLVRDGVIAAIGPGLSESGARLFDASGCIVAPGLVDLHAHLREPGFEQKGTIATETLAALRGGFTTVCAMPNTSPPPDSATQVEALRERIARDARIRVLPIGCITNGRAGKRLAELSELAAAGVVAFSDDGSPVADARLMRNALQLASALGLPLSEHSTDPALAADGAMHEGAVSERLGLPGEPAAAEVAAIARNIALAEATGAHLHIAHISLRRSLELVAEAKQRGLHVTCEVTPSHLFLTDEAVFGPGPEPLYDTNARINPPLRTEADRRALIAGVNSGVIDAIATDHAPHTAEDKLCEFELAAPGISCFETALGTVLTLVKRGELDLTPAIKAMTWGPALAWRLDRRVPGIGRLQEGVSQDVVVFDPAARRTVDVARFASRGRNTPLNGVELDGELRLVVSRGSVALEIEAQHA